MNILRITKSWLLTTAVAGVTGMLLTGVSSIALSAAPPPQVSISSTPLTVVIPTHPQVLIALTNSNSMDSSDNVIDDGNVNLSVPAGATTGRAPSSAIMTWSGNIGYSSLNASTSPVNYTIPAGFTPPLGTGTAPAGEAPYTAVIDSYSVSGTNYGGNYWGCIHNTTTAITSIPGYTSLPQPSGTPPSTSLDSWPSSVLTWDDTQTWYYNGIDTGGNNGFYEYTDPGPVTLLYHQPAQRYAVKSGVPYGIAAVDPASMLIGLNSLSYLVDSDSGTGIQPRSTGGGPPPPPPSCGPGSGPPVIPCPPPPTYYCHEWEWYPPTSTPYTNTYTYYGDNSANRLNIAKESIGSVINAYASTADFGLMTYSVSGIAGKYTWAYYMSPPGGFTFSSTYSPPTYDTNTPPNLTSEYVINPCYQATSNVSADCNNPNILAQLQTANPGLTYTQLKNYQYMLVANRSDDPPINDVFMSNDGHFTRYPAFIEDGSITTMMPPCSLAPTSSPYTGCTLTDYNAGNVVMSYSNTSPSIGFNGPTMYTYPTNAGYVAYTPQVLYGMRGYMWAGTPSPTTGNVRVPISTAGSNPTPAQVSAYVATFTPFLEPENNVPGSDPNYNNFRYAIYASATQSPIAGLLSKAAATYGSPPTGPCPPARYVILMTDGLPTEDLSGNAWPPLGSAAAIGYGVTASFNSDGSLNSTNDQALTDTINELATLNAADVKTFVIGMGPGVNPTLNPTAAKALTAMAVAGGTGTASPTGYFPGTNPSAIVADLNAILNLISAANVSSVSAAANGTSLNAGTVVYQASYSGLSGAYHDWPGDMQAYPVDPSTGVVSTSANWSAQCKLDIMATGGASVCPSTPGTGAGWDTSRLIATWNPTSSSGVPFRLANLNAAQQADLNINPDTGLSDGLASNRLNYLRGDTTNQIINGGAFRNRTHILGDIVDSTPIYIGPSSGPYTTDPTYESFAAGTASREPMLYVGANDGMLHAFDAATGDEKFAFVPNGVFSKLNMLTSTTYNLDHQFYVDGPPSAGDVKFSDNTWHTVLVGGLNDGGQSIYALDVTDPSAITNETNLASHVLWEYTSANLGLTYSKPDIALTNDVGSTNANPNGFLVFFGSGYNNSSSKPYLYAVNPQNGLIVSKDVSQGSKPLGGINLCNAVSPNPCNSSLPNGLSSVVVVNSGGNMSQPVTTVYAGDLQGNLWKVDVSDPQPKNWKVYLLFQARDSFGNPQPITVTPAVSLAPAFPGVLGDVVYFGTGQYLGIPDQTNTSVQSFYAVLDNGSNSTVTRSQLVQQVLTTTSVNINGNATDIRTVTNNTVNWTSQLGWYMDLPQSGERDITDPRLYNGEVVFTTFVPAPGATCTAGGSSFLMALNYSNGGSFPQPQLDINGDGKLDSNDQVGGQNPVGIGLGAVFASAPAILSTSEGAIQAMKLTTLSTGKIINTGERGGQPYQKSWWQIQ
ncbi:MAG: pilus assembly protein PilY [Gammaproteobacteria bacterium]|nr:pilus assembly protein PilY [Gammaproteobacteria bacterium]